MSTDVTLYQEIPHITAQMIRVAYLRGQLSGKQTHLLLSLIRAEAKEGNVGGGENFDDFLAALKKNGNGGVGHS